jgi:hypothetical protein
VDFTTHCQNKAKNNIGIKNRKECNTGDLVVIGQTEISLSNRFKAFERSDSTVLF